MLVIHLHMQPKLQQKSIFENGTRIDLLKGSMRSILVMRAHHGFLDQVHWMELEYL